MTDKPTTQVSILISHPHSNVRGNYVSLRIDDETSGLRLLDIELEPEQFMNLMASRHVYATARVPTATGVSRLFRQREHESRPVPKEWTKYDYVRGDGAVKQAVDEWAAQIAESEGWDTWRVETGSQSFYARFQRWLPRADELEG